MTVLADTSIWVDYFREREARRATELDRLLEDRSVIGCGPVLAEILKGTPPDERDEVWFVFGTLPWADLDQAAWRHVGEAAYDLRRRGRTVPLTDVMIAVAAARAEARLWTLDRDLERIGEVLPALELYRPGST